MYLNCIYSYNSMICIFPVTSQIIYENCLFYLLEGIILIELSKYDMTKTKRQMSTLPYTLCNLTFDVVGRLQ